MATQFKEKVPSGYGVSRIQQYTPEQMKLHEQGIQNVGPNSYLARLAGGGDEELWNQIESPALKQFSATQGNIASRFSQGGTGSRKSSGFMNTMNQAGSDFAQQLQSNRMGLTQQAIKDLHSMSQDLLGNRPFETQLVQKPKKEGFNWAGAGGAALGAAGGFASGGPAGALTGAQLGYNVGSGFNG